MGGNTTELFYNETGAFVAVLLIEMNCKLQQSEIYSQIDLENFLFSNSWSLFFNFYDLKCFI